MILSKELFDIKVNDILNESLASFAGDLFISYEDAMATEAGKDLSVLLYSIGINFNEVYPRFAHNILYFTVSNDSEVLYADNNNTKEKLAGDTAARLVKYIIISIIENVCFHKFGGKLKIEDSLSFKYKIRKDKVLSSHVNNIFKFNKYYTKLRKNFVNKPLNILVGIYILSDQLSGLYKYGIFITGMDKIDDGISLTVSVPKKSCIPYNNVYAEGENCASIVNSIYKDSDMTEMFGSKIVVKCDIRDEEWTDGRSDEMDKLYSMSKYVLSELIDERKKNA